jgi:hypothetical protein
MEDTTPEINRLVSTIVMSRTEEERFLMCADMHEAGKELAKIGMPSGLSSEQQKQYVYRRMYGVDLPKKVEGSSNE